MESTSLRLSYPDLLEHQNVHPLDTKSTLVMVFCSCPTPDDTFCQALKRLFPQSVIVGCSTSGQFTEDQLNDQEIVIGIAKFDATRIGHASALLEDGDDASIMAGETLANTLLEDDLKAIFVLSDGIKVNGSELIKGFNNQLPEEVIVTGGLAGDQERFEATWVLDDDKANSGAVVAIGLYGEALRVAYGSAGGWDKFGVSRNITRASGNVLYELDGKPALTLYKEYLGDRVAGLPATALLFPLALTITDEETGFEEQVVRTILSIDEEANSLTFAGDIPSGAAAQLMRANFDRLVDGASHSAKQVCCFDDFQHFDGGILVAISCVGRRLVLGERTEEELEVIMDQMPSNVTQIGFYSYGELSPNASGKCSLHNQTMTLTLFSEAT